MDEIQKILVKAGRKDLAQEYFQKVAKKVPPLTRMKISDDYDKINKSIEKLKSKVKSLTDKFENKKYQSAAQKAHKKIDDALIKLRIAIEDMVESVLYDGE